MSFGTSGKTVKLEQTDEGFFLDAEKCTQKILLRSTSTIFSSTSEYCFDLGQKFKQIPVLIYFLMTTLLLSLHVLFELLRDGAVPAQLSNFSYLASQRDMIVDLLRNPLREND